MVNGARVIRGLSHLPRIGWGVLLAANGRGSRLVLENATRSQCGGPSPRVQHGVGFIFEGRDRLGVQRLAHICAPIRQELAPNTRISESDFLDNSKPIGAAMYAVGCCLNFANSTPAGVASTVCRSTHVEPRGLMPAALRCLSSTLGVGALILLAGCGDAATAPSDSGAISLTIVSGNTQSGVVGRELPSPLVIKATQPNGNPISDLTVDFKVTSGGGSMYVVATSTNSNGKAQNYWTLGTSSAEPQRVEVRTILANGTKQVLGVFNATALAGPATQIYRATGEGETAFRGTKVVVPPVVELRDQYDNRVPNASILFSVTTGDGVVTGPTVSTNAQGQASVGSWTLGPTHGTNTLTATALGSGISTVFTATARDWDTRASMPTPRQGLGMGLVDGVAYAVGGTGADYGVFLSTVEAYNPMTDTWSPRASMPTARAHLGVGVVSSVLYAVGGSSSGGNPDGHVEAYDPVSNSWSARAPMLTPRLHLGVAVVNGILYAVGGLTELGEVGTVEAFDPVANSWTTKAPMPTARWGFGLAVYNGVIYAVGGSSNGAVGTVEAYDPVTNSWSTKAPMPRAMDNGVGASVVDGVLYAVGRVTENGADVGYLEVYNPVTDTWSIGDPMPTVRIFFGIGTVESKVYVVGGGGGSSDAIGTVEVFVP